MNTSNPNQLSRKRARNLQSTLIVAHLRTERLKALTKLKADHAEELGREYWINGVSYSGYRIAKELDQHPDRAKNIPVIFPALDAIKKYQSVKISEVVKLYRNRLK